MTMRVPLLRSASNSLQARDRVTTLPTIVDALPAGWFCLIAFDASFLQTVQTVRDFECWRLVLVLEASVKSGGWDS